MKGLTLASGEAEDGVALAARVGADLAIDGRAEQVADGAGRFSADGVDAALLAAGGPGGDAAVATVPSGFRAAYPTGVQPEPASTPGVEPQAFNGEPDAKLLERFMALIDRNEAKRAAPERKRRQAGGTA